MSAARMPWWGPARVPFLLLTPACMALGVAWCWWQARLLGAELAWPQAALAVLGALAAHVSVNAFNEVSDFKSGLDQRTLRTPFSGGSGTLPAQPALLPVAWWMAVGALALAAAIGLYFLIGRPSLLWSLTPLGLLGGALVVVYTPWVTRHPWLCLIAPGVGFGPLMLWGTSLVLGAELSWPTIVLSLIPFFLVNNLLLLNQFPDVEPDRSVGRVTLPMHLGRPGCVPVIAAQYVLAYGALVTGIALGWWPMGSALGLLTLPMAVAVWRGASAHADNMSGLLPAMALNVGVNLLTPVLVAAGMVFQG
ncbi:MAG TPA: prenyltransferase [Aquabacterium sp.]|uniref:prenyltransferase n=1 Tax=Aquabacterium sp. TaxID=1872578 RepID=UPI002E34FD63|nr:prenyltransferase [Aquabacterium sp.]HEX5373473.1 prenyltransferase [Aquabacterium sp.]